MRILYVVKNLRISNGVTSYIMNYYRHLVKDKKIKIDFLLVNYTDSPFYNEIKSNGGKIFFLPSYKTEFMKINKYLTNLFSENRYDIIHCNVINSGAIILRYAKKNNIPVRILHSHATQDGDNLIKIIRNIPFKNISKRNANVFFACSKLAGNALFKKQDFIVINNAIDIDKFIYNERNRMRIRKELNSENKKIILTVGRITEQKNPYFIVDVIDEITRNSCDFELWWFGNGNLDNEIKEYIEKKKLGEKIKLFGAVNNVNEYYSAADIFILPSLYEGLPVVGIEAQASGIYSLFSDKITMEMNINDDKNKFLDINNLQKWCDEIKNVEHYNKARKIDIKKFNNYQVQEEVNKLKNIYISLIGGNFSNEEK